MDEQLRYIPEPEHHALLEAPKGPRLSRRQAVFIGLAPVAAVFALCALFIAPPAGFPEGTSFVVEKGETHAGAARSLKEGGYIRSELVFRSFLKLFGGGSGLKAGDYYFAERESVLTVAWRTANAAYHLENVRVTIPEGLSSTEIAGRFDPDVFAHFDRAEFLEIAREYEGYLFPDTYLFLPTVTAKQVVKAMTDNYKRRIQTLADKIEAFGKPIEDVIAMASIIEEEARTMESRRTIAGILWKRLEEGMPLQVDAAFAFVNGKKASADLTLDDLKIDSPYNTYVYKGLPPGPISNPGLASIEATVTPIPTRNYFYLSDKEGEMHYAITHDEHVANKNRYLR